MVYVGFDVKSRLSKLLASAKARKIHVNLDVNKYQNLIDLGCFYCGSSLANEKGYCLDRVDSNKGYIISNIVSCCKICNRAKSNMDIWDFVCWLKKANTFTQDKLTKLDFILKTTGDSYSEKEEHDLYSQINKGKQKQRIKYVPSWDE